MVLIELTNCGRNYKVFSSHLIDDLNMVLVGFIENPTSVREYQNRICTQYGYATYFEEIGASKDFTSLFCLNFDLDKILYI